MEAILVMMLTTLLPNFRAKLIIKNILIKRTMKKGILFLLLAATFTAKAQKLKDLLYSGKLKLDSNAVIRKSDDLSKKIDTSTKKAAEPSTPKGTTVTVDPGKKVTTKTDAVITGVDVADSATTDGPVVKGNAAPVKSNNKIWKAYTDSLISTLKTEVLSSKKIKKETYYLVVDYEIGTDGAVSITNVVSDPENAFLQQQVKDRMVPEPPQLAPVLDSNNKPRKVKKKYSFSITKE